ncbi:hypothetical protein Ciccas_010900 [Cichlidogyrus casuarinus]|uniref:Uncharacterized protein n=1 Tax=Cichlidogyrus casuarinus TaxID=1844966 RepID=A0ABD2PT76_9PLAT
MGEPIVAIARTSRFLPFSRAHTLLPGGWEADVVADSSRASGQLFEQFCVGETEREVDGYEACVTISRIPVQEANK